MSGRASIAAAKQFCQNISSWRDWAGPTQRQAFKNLTIRMVAGFVDVLKGKKILVAGAFTKPEIPDVPDRTVSSIRLSAVQYLEAGNWRLPDQGAKEQGESDDDWHRSDESYSPRPTLVLQKSDDNRGSEVCVQTCDDARQL